MGKTKPQITEQEDRSQLRVEYLPLASLQPAKRHPKKHRIETVLASMSRFGYVSPMIMDERTGRLVVGHGRLESLQKAKSEGKSPPDRIRVQPDDWLVPVVRGIAFANDQDAEAYLLADNQTTVLGGWDDHELQTIIEELGRDDALVGTGFEDFYQDQLEVEQDDPTTLIDRAAELQEKWQTALGQLWLIGKHRLLCGDSTSPDHVRLLVDEVGRVRGKQTRALTVHQQVDQDSWPQASRRQRLEGQVLRRRFPGEGPGTL